MKKNNHVFIRILKYIRSLWGTLAVVVIFSLLGSYFNVILPGYTKGIVEETQKGIGGSFDVQAAGRCIFLAAGTLCLSLMCTLIQSQIAPILSQRTGQKMRREVNEKANRIPLNYFDTTPEGETLSTMTNDIDILASAFSGTLPTLITSGATLIGCLIMMFMADITLAVITVVTTIAGLMISAKVLAKGRPYFKKNQDLIAGINAHVNEDIKGHLIIKSFNAEKEVIESFEKINSELFEQMWKSQLVSSLTIPLGLLTNNLSYIAVCIAGAVLVMTGHTGMGTVVAFIQYAQIFASPISQSIQSAGTIQPALAAGERIFRMLDQPEMEDCGTTEVDVDTVRGEVEFDHVKFGYDPEHIIVHDFSCHVRPGQKVAIVGPTGAGKSTLINLLTRFYEVNGGDIRIDGTSIYDMSRKNLHDMISMVLQETWTFGGSIRDNIIYSKQGVTDERLQEVIDSCGLRDMISMSSAGLDTVLDEEAGISAGQKQLITIARAMIDDAPILILDEATSSVDTRTERLISDAVDKLMEGRTGFVIAHRLSTIRNADMILVLKDGDIIEKGTHEELMAKGGFYSDLYMSQFDNA
jgi:ATP-binding cassette subfamily B protein